MKQVRCFLKPGKEKPLKRFHPWVFSGAIDRIDEGYEAGDLVQVHAHDEMLLGTGFLNPSSQIAIRMLAFGPQVVDADFFRKRLRSAALSRQGLQNRLEATNAFRLVHAEGDGLPGLIVDRYDRTLVVQIHAAGLEPWRETLVEELAALVPGASIFEKSDAETRKREGLGGVTGLLAGPEPPEGIVITENGYRFTVDIRQGQKTGFFLDQRENRKLAGSLSAGRRVLNAFAYTGAFSVYAAGGGAVQVVSVESSAAACARIEPHLKLNHLPVPHETVKADVFRYFREPGPSFDLIILDPPAFCKHKSQVLQASRGYKDIQMQAIRRLAPGGILAAFSCSSFVSAELFRKILFSAASDAGREMRILDQTAQPFDHPVHLGHPEGEYLKGLFCQLI